MGKTTREIAKSAVLSLTVKDAQVARITVSTSFGFGLELRATKSGFEAFVAAVEALGLDPMLNRFRRQDDSGEPIGYIYDMFIDIPDGWQKA